MSTRWRWPIILAAAGLLLWLLASFTLLQGFSGWNVPLRGPGVTEINIPAAGDYRLWHLSTTVVDGQLRVVDDALPAGTTLEIRSARGERIPIQLQAAGMNWEFGGNRRVAVGRVTIPEAGIYLVSIQGFDTPRHFSLNEIRWLHYFMRALLFAIPGVLLFTGALIGLLVISTRPKSQST